MECRQIKLHLLAHMDGDLDPASAARVEKHLERCRHCRDTRDEMYGFDATLRQPLAFPGQPYAYRQLAACLPDVRPVDEVAAFLPQLRVSGRAPKLAMAALMLVFVLLGQVSLREGRNSVSTARDLMTGHDARIKSAFLEYLKTDLENAEGVRPARSA